MSKRLTLGVALVTLGLWIAPAIQAGAPHAQTQAQDEEQQEEGGDEKSGEPAEEESIEEIIDRKVREQVARELDARQAESKEPSFTLHGGAYVWNSEPLTNARDRFSELYTAYFVLDVAFGNFNFHIYPRARDTRFRSYSQGTIWVEEVYISWQPPNVPGMTFKAGKFYTRLGKFWDGNFTGNIQYLDGLKLDPDMGIGIEGTVKLDEGWDAEYALQFHTVDGSINGSLAGRDTLSIPGADQRDSFIARFAPRYSWKEGQSVLFGLSGQSFCADFADGSPIPDNRVERLAAELEFVLGDVNFWGEYIEQDGFSVLDFPLPGMPSNDVRYTWTGISYKRPRVDYRLLYSKGDYRTSGVEETITLPGIIFDLNDHMKFWFEYFYWERKGPGSLEATVDESITTALLIHF